MKFGRRILLLLIALQIARFLPTGPRLFDVLALLTGASIYWTLSPRALALLVREAIDSPACARF